MQKRHLFTIINLMGLVLGLLLWVISLVSPETLPNFTFAWACFIITIIWAVSFTIRVFFEKEVILKKSWTIIAGVFYLMATGSIIGALAIKGSLVLPIICLALAGTALIGALVLGGKKWDEGDNQKPGYKTYRERKAEEEALKLEEESKTEENKE